jgi:hypothetical protein
VRGLATKGSASSFTDLARRLPKTYQKPAASTAAELGRLLDIDAAGNVRRKRDGQIVKTATVRPAIAGAQSAIAAAQPDIAIEQRSSSVAPHPAISGAQAEIAAAQPEIAVEQRAPAAAAAQTVAAPGEGISAEQLLSFLATRRKSQIW